MPGCRTGQSAVLAWPELDVTRYMRSHQAYQKKFIEIASLLLRRLVW